MMDGGVHLAQTILSLCAKNPNIACMRTSGKAEQFEIRHVNEAWERLTGYNRADVVGEKSGLSFLKGRETRSRIISKLRSNVQAKVAFFGDVINYKKDGTKFVNRLSIVPLPDGGFIETCMDVLRSSTSTYPDQEHESQACAGGGGGFVKEYSLPLR